MSKPDKQRKIVLRSGHLPDMTVAFSTNKEVTNGFVLGLAVQGPDAVPATTSNGPRSFTVGLNPRSGDLTIAESRGPNSSLLKKAIALREDQ